MVAVSFALFTVSLIIFVFHRSVSSSYLDRFTYKRTPYKVFLISNLKVQKEILYLYPLCKNDHDDAGLGGLTVPSGACVRGVCH